MEAGTAGSLHERRISAPKAVKTQLYRRLCRLMATVLLPHPLSQPTGKVYARQCRRGGEAGRRWSPSHPCVNDGALCSHSSYIMLHSTFCASFHNNQTTIPPQYKSPLLPRPSLSIPHRLTLAPRVYQPLTVASRLHCIYLRSTTYPTTAQDAFHIRSARLRGARCRQPSPSWRFLRCST